MPKPRVRPPYNGIVEREYKGDRSDKFGFYLPQQALELIKGIEPINHKSGIRPFKPIKRSFGCTFSMNKATTFELLRHMAHCNNPSIEIVPFHGVKIIGVIENENPFNAKRKTRVEKAKGTGKLHRRRKE
jgi:hypothetical protein